MQMLVGKAEERIRNLTSRGTVTGKAKPPPKPRRRQAAAIEPPDINGLDDPGDSEPIMDIDE